MNRWALDGLHGEDDLSVEIFIKEFRAMILCRACQSCAQCMPKVGIWSRAGSGRTTIRVILSQILCCVYRKCTVNNMVTIWIERNLLFKFCFSCSIPTHLFGKKKAGVRGFFSIAVNSAYVNHYVDVMACRNLSHWG